MLTHRLTQRRLPGRAVRSRQNVVIQASFRNPNLPVYQAAKGAFVGIASLALVWFNSIADLAYHSAIECILFYQHKPKVALRIPEHQADIWHCSRRPQ
jgi:hypothetical protein